MDTVALYCDAETAPLVTLATPAATDGVTVTPVNSTGNTMRTLPPVMLEGPLFLAVTVKETCCPTQ